jgi:hypothetical protein
VDQAELLKRAVAFLESQEIPYLLVGSLASGVYGEPRLTYEIDIEHIRDIVAMFDSSGERIDKEYLQIWIDELALADEWKHVARQVEKSA